MSDLESKLRRLFPSLGITVQGTKVAAVTFAIPLDPASRTTMLVFSRIESAERVAAAVLRHAYPVGWAQA